MVSDLVVSIILEWIKLDIDMRNSTTMNFFKRSLLYFVSHHLSDQHMAISKFIILRNSK